MTSNEVDAILTECERTIDSGDIPNLRETRFWSAVATVKRDVELTEVFADRIGAIDRVAHASWAKLLIPLRVGTTLAVVGALVGVGIVASSIITDSALVVDPSVIPSPLVKGFAFLVGVGVIIGSTHGLGHLVVGRSADIRFTCWFIGSGRPQPGVKTDYASYLRASPISRAWMHASGAIITKVIPFLFLPVAIAARSIPSWVPVVLVVLGVVQIITDVVWSTKASDWAKFSREMRYAEPH